MENKIVLVIILSIVCGISCMQLATAEITLTDCDQGTAQIYTSNEVYNLNLSNGISSPPQNHCFNVYYVDNVTINCVDLPYSETYDDNVLNITSLGEGFRFLDIALVSNITVNNCKLHGNGTKSHVIVIQQEAGNIILNNITVYDTTNTFTTMFDNYPNIIINNSNFYRNGLTVINFYRTTINDITIENTNFHNYSESGSISAIIRSTNHTVRNIFLKNINITGFNGSRGIMFDDTGNHSINYIIENLNIRTIPNVTVLGTTLLLYGSNDNRMDNNASINNLTIIGSIKTNPAVVFRNINLDINDVKIINSENIPRSMRFENRRNNTEKNLYNHLTNVELKNIYLEFSSATNIDAMYDVCMNNVQNNVDIDTLEEYRTARTNISLFGLMYGYNGVNLNNSCNQNNTGWFPIYVPTSIYPKIAINFNTMNLTAYYGGTSGGMNSDFTSNASLTFFSNIMKDETFCSESWIMESNMCIEGQKLISYYDENDCGTANNLPSDNGTYTTEGCCIENWTRYLSPDTCIDGTQIILYIDSNMCGTITNLPSDNGTMQTCCVENWMPQLQPARCTSGTQLLTYTDSNKCGTTDFLPTNNSTTQKCCVERWVQKITPAKCANGTQLITYTDANTCGTTYFLPANNGTVQECSFCTENWIRKVTPNRCLNGTQLITYTDRNNCDTTEYLPMDNGTYQACCLENWTKYLEPKICVDGTQQILYYDNNGCGTDVLLPNNNGTFKTCCVEQWVPYLSPTICKNGTQQLLYKDVNKCGTTLTRPANHSTYIDCCVENWVKYLEPPICTTGRQQILYDDANDCGTTIKLPINNGTYQKCRIPRTTK
ncbi:MAG: hypothetical protein ACP5NW_02160 [Candidatus Woesearchaeota archaeon]